MRRRLLTALTCLALLGAACGLSESGRDRSADAWDLVIYGGTSAGVVAAVQARQMGVERVLVIEPTPWLGGLSSGGLGATDIGNKAAIGGLARDFYRRVRAHYADASAWVAERAEEFAGRGHRAGEDAAWTFEPSVADAIFEAMVAEHAIEVWREARLTLGRGGVEVRDRRIRSVRLEDGRSVRGRVWIDATYEGDLLAGAGVTYRIGREAEAEFGEGANGVRAALGVHHQFVVDVDPYVVPGDASSGLLPGVQAGGPGTDGDADLRVQAYCYRLCATDVPANQVPWPEPADYDEARYEVLFRNFEAGDLRRPWHPVWMPNRKTDANNNFAFSTDHIGANWTYPEAGWAERAAILADHENYQKGLMWSLANHPRVPAEVRADFAKWGLAKDEFVDTGHWPRQLYIREARRMVGAEVMTEQHCRGRVVAPDPVGLAAYSMDSHHVQRYVDERGFCRNEGDVQIHGIVPYPISMQALLPRRVECQNLVVPVCLSATHIAFGSIRMEPVFMVLGQSAATLACFALERGCAVQDVDYERLRARLLADGQALEWRPKDMPGLDPLRIEGRVVDDRQADKSPGWTHSTSTQPFVGHGYLHDGNSAKGSLTVAFEAKAPTNGTYEVLVSYSAHANRARNVPVLVEVGAAREVIRVDQRSRPPVDGMWLSLGRVEVENGQVVRVRISNAGTDGYVVADAMLLRRRD